MNDCPLPHILKVSLNSMARDRSAKNSRKDPATSIQRVAGIAEPEQRAVTPLNFKVPEEFHREFKTYAAQHGKKMVQVLQEAFTLLKAQQGH